MRRIEKIALAMTILLFFTAAGLTIRDRTSAPDFTIEQVSPAIYEEVSAEAAEELININTADENKLCDLHGVGPVIARRIIDYREEYGFFSKPGDIIDVPGIGFATFEKIKDNITV